MSVNLKKNEKQLLAAYNDVINTSSETNWWGQGSIPCRWTLLIVSEVDAVKLLNFMEVKWQSYCPGGKSTYIQGFNCLLVGGKEINSSIGVNTIAQCVFYGLKCVGLQTKMWVHDNGSQSRFVASSATACGLTVIKSSFQSALRAAVQNQF